MVFRSLLRKLEAWSGLDPVAGAVAKGVTALTNPTPVKNLLTGTWLGHPLHPLLTDLPIGAWTGAAVLDLTGGKRARTSADALVAFGIAAAIPTAASGAADWGDYNDDRVRRVGLVHAVANSVSLGFQVASLVSRRRGNRARGRALSMAGLGAMAAGGYLGGHLAYGLASGVDRTTFQDGPDQWVDVLDEAALQDSKAHTVVADGVPVVLVRQGGVIHALAATCSHMGGPLGDGDVEDGCIRCPWHASTFRLDDGSVVRGPATAPQPPFETRVAAGRVSVRAGHRPSA
jgi:nitrite reductase/ring-hydroxylating ferredoxin subunit/uncharacterized membrane protein